MTTDNDDIERLLADILDDEKPLPTAPTPTQTVMDVASNSGPEAPERAAEEAIDDPETFLEGLLNGTIEPAAPTTECEEVTQRVTTPATDAIFTDSDEREEGAQVQPLKMPTFTADDFAETMDIRNFATLVTLNTARWHAKVKDRQAAKSAAAANDADEGAFEVRKRLLVGADSLLKAVHKAIDEARAAHYEMTLPWSTTS